MLINLQDEVYVKEKLNMNYPVLKKIINESNISEEQMVNGSVRYYVKPIKSYLLCNDWYDKNKNMLDTWLENLDS